MNYQDIPRGIADDLRRYQALAASPIRSEGEEAEVQSLLRRLRDAGFDPGWEPVPREEIPPYPGDPEDARDATEIVQDEYDSLANGKERDEPEEGARAMKYRCWDPERQDEEDALAIEAEDPARAAELFAEKRFSGDSYPQHRTVHVAAQDVKVYEVETRNSPKFYATERRAK